MAGVGKLLKQAQRMQKQMQAVQEKLAEQVIEVSSGGGAIQIAVTGQGEFKSVKIDPEFLKEDAEFIEATLLSAIQEAALKAKDISESAMGSVSSGMAGLPGLI